MIKYLSATLSSHNHQYSHKRNRCQYYYELVEGGEWYL